MKATKCSTLLLAAVLLVQQGASGQVCPPDVPPFPVGTAFTYQGLLTCTAGVVTSPVDDTCDFAFSLWDCEDGGNMIAGPLDLIGHEVTAGHFTVQLDFGNVYDGNARFLEITVTCPPPCGDPPGASVTLAPRTELTPVPYALFAQKATPLPDCTLAGDKDNFASSADPADVIVMRQEFDKWINTRPGTNNHDFWGGVPLPFDRVDIADNHDFGYSFQNLPPICCPASLEIHLKADGGNTPTDSIALQFSNVPVPAFAWGYSMNNLDALFGDGDGVWRNNDELTAKLDLCALPLAGGGTLNLLPRINADGFLDFYLQDDTGVDYIELCYKLCKTPGGAGDDDWIRVAPDGPMYPIHLVDDVGIGTKAPTEKLDVNGQVRVRNLPPGSFDMVTADADGVLYRNTGGLADDDWDITTNTPDMFSIPTGNVGIGTPTPVAKLHVHEDISVTLNSAARVTFSNAAGSISTRGLSVESMPLNDRGSQAGIIAHTSKIAGSDAQRGAADGILATTHGFFGQGLIRGVSGFSTPNVLSNFDSTRTSHGLGGYFVAKPADTLTLNSTGTYWVGGVYGEVGNAINGTLPEGVGAVAGVIGVDNNTGTAKSFAGYFKGDVCITGNLCVKGSITALGAISPFAGCVDGCPSDRRLKNHIKPISQGLDKVTRLRGVSFQWRRDEFPKKNFRDGRQIGLIAQEVAEVLPEVVVTDPDGYKGIQYGKVVAVLVEAIKEQQQIINLSRSELGDLKQRLAAVERAVGVEAKVLRASSAGLGGTLTAIALALAALIGFMMHAHSRRGGVR